jgi:hypothetical protein
MKSPECDEKDVPKNSSVSEEGSSGEDGEPWLVPVSKAKHVYEKTLLEVLETRDYLSHENTYRSSLSLPMWIRTVVLVLERKTDKSRLFIVRKIIEHGFQILQEKYKTLIAESEKQRASLFYCRNQLVRKIVVDLRVKVELGSDFTKMSVELQKNLAGAITKTAAALNIEFASFQRLCMAYSLATIPEEELPSKEPLELAKHGIEVFEESLENLIEELELHAKHYNNETD